MSEQKTVDVAASHNDKIERQNQKRTKAIEITFKKISVYKILLKNIPERYLNCYKTCLYDIYNMNFENMKTNINHLARLLYKDKNITKTNYYNNLYPIVHNIMLLIC